MKWLREIKKCNAEEYQECTYTKEDLLEMIKGNEIKYDTENYGELTDREYEYLKKIWEAESNVETEAEYEGLFENEYLKNGSEFEYFFFSNLDAPANVLNKVYAKIIERGDLFDRELLCVNRILKNMEESYSEHYKYLIDIAKNGNYVFREALFDSGEYLPLNILEILFENHKDLNKLIVESENVSENLLRKVISYELSENESKSIFKDLSASAELFQKAKESLLANLDSI